MFYGQCWARAYPIPVLPCLGSLTAVMCREECCREDHGSDSGTQQTVAVAAGAGLEIDVKGSCISASLSSHQGLTNVSCIVVCSSLKLITLIINNPGRCSSPRSGWGRQKRFFFSRVAGEECPGMSGFVLSIFVSDWREHVNTLQLLWLHLCHSGLCSGALFTVWEVVFPVLSPSLLHPHVVQNSLPLCQP